MLSYRASGDIPTGAEKFRHGRDTRPTHQAHGLAPALPGGPVLLSERSGRMSREQELLTLNCIRGGSIACGSAPSNRA